MQINQRGFARAGRPDDGDLAAAFGLEADVAQNRFTGVVSEADILEAHGPVARRKRNRAGFLGHRWRREEHLAQPAGGDDRVLILLVDDRDRLQAAEDLPHRRAENQKVAGAQFPLEHQEAAGQKEDQIRRRGDPADHRREIGEEPDARPHALQECLAVAFVALDFLAFDGERLDDVNAGNILGDDRDVAVVGFHDRLGCRLHAAAEAQDVPRPKRQRQQRQHCQPRREREDQHHVSADDQCDLERGEHRGLNE
jgi:hypothetical protein